MCCIPLGVTQEVTLQHKIQVLCCRLILKCDGTRGKPDFVFRRNGLVHLIRWGRQFSRLLAAEVCASAVVMLDTLRSEVV